MNKEIKYLSIVGISAVAFFLVAGLFLISDIKSQEIRTDMVYSVGRGDCISSLHALGMSQNGWYKLNNLFIFSNGIEENAKILARETCDRSPIVTEWGEENPWSIEYILEDVDRYYDDFYKEQFGGKNDI